MKPRSLRINLEKNEDAETPLQKIYDIDTEKVKDVMLFGMKCVCAYVAVDTVRKVMIALAEKE